MVLLRVQCEKCNRELISIDAVPEKWDGALTFTMCKCERPDPRRIVDVMLKKGVDALPICREIAWTELRQHVETAWRTGRTVRLLT